MKKIQYYSLERESDYFKNTGTECIRGALTCQLPFTVFHFLICSACLTTAGRFTYTFEIQPSSGGRNKERKKERKKTIIYFCAVLIHGVEFEKKSCRKFGSSEESFVLSCPKGSCTYYQPKITSTSVRGWSVNWVFHTACSMCHQKWINCVLMRLRHCAASPALRSLLYVAWKKTQKHKQPTKQPSAIAWWLISRFQNSQRAADAHMY